MTQPDEMPATPYDNPDMSGETGIDPTEEPDTKTVADPDVASAQKDQPESDPDVR